MEAMTYRGSLPATWPFESLGSIAVVDLESALQLYGRDMLPFPLGRSRPAGSLWLATREVPPIADRLNDGDLRGVRTWVEALVRPDVCVECRVHYLDEGTADRRLHGSRAGEFGFVAIQARDRDGVDIVDIYGVPPAMLGAAVAETAGLVGAGAHPRIAVTADHDRLPDPPEVRDEYDDLGFLIPRAGQAEPTVPIVDGRDVAATGTVQSRCSPARHWGTDPDRRLLQWIHVSGDGDYLYEHDDAGYAEPLDAEMLSACIDGLIADERAMGREGRGGLT